MSLEWRIARRYLTSKRRSGVISVIGLIAIGGVFVGVAALVIVMSVMGGLQRDLREKILTNTPHLLIQRYNSEPLEDYVRRRHAHLQLYGAKNAEIFRIVQHELAGRVVAAPRLTERQLRRIVYG